MDTKKYQAVLFDLDGTLWDSTVQILPAWNRVLQRRGTGHVLTLDEMKGYMGKTIGEIAAIMLPHIPASEGLSVLKECCREEVITLRETGGALYPDLWEELRKLAADYVLAIVSNCQDGYIQSFLYAHQLSAFFSDYECSGRTGLSKGENIRLVMDRSRIESAIYVGDTQGDWDAAKTAGVPFIHAAYGFGKFSCLNEKTQPLASINAFDQLRPLLSEMG